MVTPEEKAAWREWNRERWEAAERVLTRQHGKLDLQLIRTELKPLLELKEQRDSLNKFEQLIIVVERRLQIR